ncbi:MAG TPA: YncE family protein [Candidatus Nanopelagicaceae bacterium]|nr:YncE family protein [Candidatus Nanopelagicaceae bacterium]
MTRSFPAVGRVRIPGGSEFDHAAVHLETGRVFVANTSLGTVEVVDPLASRLVTSIEDCQGASGVVVDGAHRLAVAASRAGGHVLLIDVDSLQVVAKIQVGPAPNGLALDGTGHRLLVADVKNNEALLIDTTKAEVVAQATLPGRPRWAVHDPATNRFYLNIASPAQVAALDPTTLELQASWKLNAQGPHGLDVDLDRRLLLVACDDGALLGVNADTGTLAGRLALPGPPDVTFCNPGAGEAYVAVGDAGALVVASTRDWKVTATLPTGPGAHTFAFDQARQLIHLLLPAAEEIVTWAVPGAGLASVVGDHDSN